LLKESLNYANTARVKREETCDGKRNVTEEARGTCDTASICGVVFFYPLLTSFYSNIWPQAAKNAEQPMLYLEKTTSGAGGIFRAKVGCRLSQYWL
jgi:hypothetical protein